MKAALSELFFQQPTARFSRPFGSRPACCNNGVCRQCPIDAKFTVQNSLAALYEDPRVQLLCGATVRRVNTRHDVATGAEYEFSGREQRADAELVALGAGGIHNPFLLLRSGFDDPGLGRHLHEQTGVFIDVELDGVENFDGSTSITALGYMLYAGAHRRERAATLFEFWNAPHLRNQRGKWRQFLRVKALVEDLPSPESQQRAWEHILL
jgi:choline dehydrogenase-like flavoprotein